MEILKAVPDSSKIGQNVVFGESFVGLGRVLWPKGVPWRCLWGVLGTLGGLLEISWRFSGSLEGPLAGLLRPLATLGASWGSSEVSLGSFLRLLGPLESFLGASERPRRASWELLGTLCPTRTINVDFTLIWASIFGRKKRRPGS